MHKVSEVDRQHYLVEQIGQEPLSVKLWKSACKSVVKPVSSISSTGLISLLGPVMNGPSTRKIKSTRDICVKRKQHKNTKYYILSNREELQRIPTTIFYLHGGANVLQLNEGHVSLAKSLCLETGATIVLVDYLLVPKYTSDIIFDQTYELFTLIGRSAKMNDERFVLMGDSAGAGMVAGFSMKCYDEKEDVTVAKLILISPWLDLSMGNQDIVEPLRRKDVILNKKFLCRAGREYAGEMGVKHPYISPMFGDVSKLAPMMVVSSDRDILNPDALKWIQKSRDAGVSTVYYEYMNEMHDFLAFEPGRFHYLIEQMNVFLQG